MTDNCKNSLLSNSDIIALYENSMKLNHDSYTHAVISSGECLTNQKNVSLVLMNEEEELSKMINRMYFKNHPLVASQNKGNVAYHQYFVLKEEYIGKGIAKALHKSELSIYQNKIDEIQLHAICDGIISWIRLGFSFSIPDSKYLVYENLMNYLETIKKLSDDKLDEINDLFFSEDGSINENAFREIEREQYFLNGNNFTTWFLNQNIDLPNEEQKPTIKMYKEVS